MCGAQSITPAVACGPGPVANGKKVVPLPTKAYAAFARTRAFLYYI